MHACARAWVQGTSQQRLALHCSSQCIGRDPCCGRCKAGWLAGWCIAAVPRVTTARHRHTRVLACAPLLLPQMYGQGGTCLHWPAATVSECHTQTRCSGTHSPSAAPGSRSSASSQCGLLSHHIQSRYLSAGVPRLRKLNNRAGPPGREALPPNANTGQAREAAQHLSKTAHGWFGGSGGASAQPSSDKCRQQTHTNNQGMGAVRVHHPWTWHQGAWRRGCCLHPRKGGRWLRPRHASSMVAGRAGGAVQCECGARA